MSLVTGHEAKAHYLACVIATTACPYAECRRAIWASTVAVPASTDQAGNIGPQAAEAAEESAEGFSTVGNIVPQVGNIVPQTSEAVEEDAEGVSSVVTHEVKKPSTRVEVSFSTSNVDNQVPPSESKTAPTQPAEDQYHIFDGVTGHQVKVCVVLLDALPEV
ncbi:Pol protein [Phytophthora palmivora]|uniref:Pol protein n=1 Tax=Phytophthora palmivora TaxID=4796 RepID=A0A2P4X3X6_9STRA|nr:Pol protein [Phytophthora palmivora]